jgi:spore coat protein U-like protein
MPLAGALWAVLAVATAHAAGGLSCSVAATPLAFGAYVPLSSFPDDFTATISVTCTTTGSAAVPVQGSIALVGASGAYGRQLTDGASRLRYHTYLNAARTLSWGDGSGSGGTQAVSGVVSPTAPFRQFYTVYGRILARQSFVRVGTYADQITVILTY